MRILVYPLILGSVVSAILYPWTGVLSYYFVAILAPQAIWLWIFEGFRLSFYFSLATMLGFLKSLLKGEIDFSIFKHKQNLYLFIILIFIHISNLASQYMYDPLFRDNQGNGMINPASTLDTLNKVYLFYFIAVLLIDTKKKFHYLVMSFIVIILYFIYWANMQYFSGQMQFSLRLQGPGGRSGTTIYSDENTFGMLFVVGMPFLYFMGSYYKSKIIKYTLWGAIPWAWHAVFLTGSRGAFLGTGFVCLYIMLRSRSKLLGVGLLVALVLAFSLQGGNMKERADTLKSEEGRVNPRLQSWQAGLKMMADRPFSGVGLGKFLVAYPDYADTQPYVAHNTAIQLGSECGIVAGLMYLLIGVKVFTQFWGNRKIAQDDHVDSLLSSSNEAIVSSIASFFLCSIFLNLITYEVFYFLLILSLSCNRFILNDQEKSSHDLLKEAVVA